VAGYDEVGDPLDPDDEHFYVHLWWAFRQIQDPGNMMSSPEEAAAVVVSLALTIVGLFMVSFLIGLGTDVVRELMELSQLRPPGLRGHTIVVNIDFSTQQLLHELLRYSRKLLPAGSVSLRWLIELARNTQRGIRGARYLVVGRSPDPPDFLRQPELARIVYRQVHVDDESFLVRTDVADAQRVVLLADFDAADPDAETIQGLLTITESLREADEENERRNSLFGLPSLPKRARLLIAEVLDESNVPAARAAITGNGNGRDSARTRAFVVPSERLIALFIACITRRPGVGPMLEELLTSHGHELYTLFFELPGLGYQASGRPEVGCDPSAVMADLVRRSRSLPSNKRLIPVGVLMSGDRPDDIRVFINPDKPGVSTTAPVDRPATSSNSNRCLGFVAIADNFSRACELAEQLVAHPTPTTPPSTPDPAPGELEVGPGLPQFGLAPTTKLDRVLVCGFRSGTVSMVEALIQAQPSTHILIMVADEAALHAAWDDFDAHTKLVRRGLLADHHGQFHSDKANGALTWHNPDAPAPPPERPHVRLVIGDWSSSRKLTALPLGFGHVGELDAVILISSEHRGSDARTAKTLMKIETLTQGPRIVAEVLDVELARRLRRRSIKQNSARVSVYSIQELRAFFMFQAIVVPAFDLVYAELMGPWGESFMQLQPVANGAPAGVARCSFEALADHLAAQRQVLVAIELCDQVDAHEHSAACRTKLHVAAGSAADGEVELARVTSVWVISTD
jgi:hypothetical protein